MSHRESKVDKEKSFPERVKRFLKSDKKCTKRLPEIKFTEAMITNLNSSSPLEVRLKALRDLEQSMLTKKLQDASIDKVWCLVKDLLDMKESCDTRHAVLQFLSYVCSTTERLGHRRVFFMKYVMDHYLAEDTACLFQFFQCFVNEGRDIEHIEKDLGPFLIKWAPFVFSSSFSTVSLIDLITNIMKFNAAHLDDHIIQEIVTLVVNQLYQSNSKEELEAHFCFMDTLVAYVYIPSGTLALFISALARLVSIPFVVEDVWKVMRKLLCTQLGNSSLRSLIELIETSGNFHIVRGAIYLVTCALWCHQNLNHLSIRTMAVLPTLAKASESSHALVVTETAVSISKLIHAQPPDLQFPAWEILIEILERLFYFAVHHLIDEQSQMIFDALNSTVDDIENLIEEDRFEGDLGKFYSLVDRYSKQRKIESVHLSLEYNVRFLNPYTSHWITRLTSLVHRHFREEERPPIRLQALAKLRYIFDKYQGTAYAETICSTVVLNELDEIDKDSEVIVRKAAVSLVVHMVLSLHSLVVELLLKLVEKVVLSPFKRFVEGEREPFCESEVEDVHEGVQGLILIFKKKIWYLPSSVAIQSYQILMSFLELHYRNVRVLGRVTSIRKLIFEMIFELRADADYRLGLPNCPEAHIPEPHSDESSVEMKHLLPKYSPYIVVDHKYGQNPLSVLPYSSSEIPHSGYFNDGGEDNVASPDLPVVVIQRKRDRDSYEGSKILNRILNHGLAAPAPSFDDDASESEISDPTAQTCIESDILIDGREPKIVITHLSLTKAAMIVIVAMKKERDWLLLKMILEKVPHVLQNKALILSRDGNDIDYLATTLCDLISNEALRLPDSLFNTPPKFTKSDFDAYVYPVMASLSSYHEHLDALFQRNIIQCLQNGMSSKSAPQCVSALTLSILEMRGTMIKLLRDVMIQLSKISATLQNSQPTLEFLSTLLHLPSLYADFNPSQYLAVFAICIPYTNPFKFNHYIVTLAYHVICMWFTKCRMIHRKNFVHFIAKNLNMILLNEETALRMKLSNLNDQKGDVDMFQFHRDLRETCVDFMTRNCFDSFAPEMIRSPVSQLLFNEGQQQSWLVGTRIITITTSGCSRKPIRNGLCFKCIQLCSPQEIRSSHLPDADEMGKARRRHKSDFVPSASVENGKSLSKTKDDLHMSSVYAGDGFESEDRSKWKADLEQRRKSHVCCCWCSPWAEIVIRQPTGNISYGMRVLNPQTHITKEDSVPVQDLSSFYSCVGEASATVDQLLFDSQISNADPASSLSWDSEVTHGSETASFGSDEWHHCASDPSSDASSLVSSETRLNAKVDYESVFIAGGQNSPVQHCLSNPEVSKVAHDSSISMGSVDTLKLRHPLAHSVSLMSEPFRKDDGGGAMPFGGINSASAKRFSDLQNSSSLFAGDKPRHSRNSVVRCNSGVGSSISCLASSDPSRRVRHSSAMQTVCSSPVCEDDEEVDLEPQKRGRGYTISDMNPASRVAAPAEPTERRRPTIASGEAHLLSGSTISVSSFSAEDGGRPGRASREAKGGVSPSSVFLQLYYQGCLGTGFLRPILLPTHQNEVKKAIELFDLIKPHEHHRIGVLYVGPHQSTEAQIFANTTGSERYYHFLEGIGSVYNLSDFTECANLGGLDKRGSDGNLIHMWQDDLMQVVFHVATSMPNRESDPNGHCKKKCIGNDYVTIVYNDGGSPYSLDTIKSQFNHSVVEVVPGDHNTNCIRLLTKAALKEFVSWNNCDFLRVVSDASLPLLVRQLALHANLASTVWESLKRSQYRPYATNWMERLRKVRKLRELVLGKSQTEKHLSEIQLLQVSTYEPDDVSFLDFSDMIDVEKATDVKGRSRTASFLNRR